MTTVCDTKIVIEVVDLKAVNVITFKKLKRLSFGKSGWMTECMDQVINGYAIKAFYDPNTDEVAFEQLPVIYDKAHALIARDEDGEILGWALVRHPRKRIRFKYRKYDWYENIYTDKIAYAGRRSDFMVYVAKKNRKKQIARKLLLVAFNNFGRLDAYPHDTASKAFYGRNKAFVTPYDTNKFDTPHFESREVY